MNVNVIPMITFKSNFLIAIVRMYFDLAIQIFILILVITLFITFPLIANINIMTGYTYIPVTNCISRGWHSNIAILYSDLRHWSRWKSRDNHRNSKWSKVKLPCGWTRVNLAFYSEYGYHNYFISG